MGVIVDAGLLTGWTPTEFDVVGARSEVRWRYLEGLQFTDSSFDRTVERGNREPFRLLFGRVTDLSELEALVRASPGLPVAGLIFHVSRCGSTLVSQMLAQIPSVLVLSEPPPVDRALRLRGDVPEVTRWLVEAMGQARSFAQSRLVVKLDAWALMFLDVLELALPDVPAVFVYRDPIEVLVSQMRRRGAHMVPGALGIDWPGTGGGQTGEEFCANVLADLFDAALPAVRDGRLLPVNYTELPHAVLGDIATRFGIAIDSSSRSACLSITGHHAREPGLPFAPDGPEKQSSASPALRAAAAVRAVPAYQEVERLRVQGL